MLSERYIVLKLDDGKSITRLVSKGLPQGSVLSPILYNIYTQDLKSSLNSVNVLQYADDLLIYCCHKSSEKASSSITQSLINLRTWLDLNGLDLSPAKSTIVLFTRSRTPPPIFIFYEGNQIPVKANVKFLGIV